MRGQTLDRAAGIGLDVHVLPAWYDVDDMRRCGCCIREICGEEPFAAGNCCRYRAAIRRQLLSKLLADRIACRLLEPDIRHRSRDDFNDRLTAEAAE